MTRLNLLLFTLLTLFMLSHAGPAGAQRSDAHLDNFSDNDATSAEAHFRLDMTHGTSRQFHVEARFPDRPGSETTMRLPVWSPGSYLVREYAKNVSKLRAFDGDGRELEIEKTSKNRWRVRHEDGDTVVLRYQVYGGDHTVRTPYLTSLRAEWQATSVFMTPADEELSAWTIRTVAPEGWQSDVIASKRNGADPVWHGSTLDRFYDTVGMAGPLTAWDFVIGGIPHRMVFDGPGNFDRDGVLPMIEKGFRVVEELFRGDKPLEDGVSPALPIDDYAVLVTLTNDGGGGLEHFRGTLLLWERWSLASRWDRLRFLTLNVHEYFHIWNVKHIRPASLQTYLYDEENYTRNLFEIEGFTSYYDIVLSGRAVGRMDDPASWVDDWLALWEREIQTHEGYPGKQQQSLRESSFDAWIKYYRKDENYVNRNVHYYRKGALVSALLDSEIRRHSDGDKSLDDVMRRLWDDYLRTGDGYNDPDGVMEAVEAATGYDAREFFDQYVDGTAPLPYDRWLSRVGLELSEPDSAAWPGVKFHSAGDRVMMATVLEGGPGDRAGLSNGDELIAIDGWRVIADPAAADWDYEERLEALSPGETVTLTIGREGKLLEVELTLGVDPSTVELLPVENPTDDQRRAFERWSGLPHPKS